MKWKATRPIFILNYPFDENYNEYFVFIKRIKAMKIFKVKIFEEFSKIIHREL